MANNESVAIGLLYRWMVLYQVLGKALRGLPRDKIYVSSKAGRYGPTRFDFSAARVKQSVRESLDRLQLTYLDIVHCHDVEFTKLDQVCNSLPVRRTMHTCLFHLHRLWQSMTPRHFLHISFGLVSWKLLATQHAVFQTPS